MVSLSLPTSPAKLRRARMLDGVVYMAAVFGFAWFAAITTSGSFPADLAAVYYAGRFFAEGAHDLVYWASWTAYPQEWIDAINADGYDRPAYAFIYPPVWAALVAPLTTWLSPGAFFQVVIVVHMFLFCATVRFVRDIFDHKVWLTLWALPVMIVMPLTMFGAALIGLGQPTAILYFMIILGFRALVEAAPRRAAVWLALAATLKIFPVVLGVIFLTRRFRAGLIAYVGTGLGMVALSFLLAPVEMHRQFVAVAGYLTENTVISYANLSLQSVLMRLQLLVAGVTQGDVYSLATAGWVKAANLLAVLGFAIWFHHAARVASPLELRQKVMPVAMLAMTLIAPIAWTHYFTVALAFLPGLFLVLPARPAVLIAGVVVVANLPMVYVSLGVPWYPMLGFVSMVGLMLAFALAPNRETGPAAD